MHGVQYVQTFASLLVYRITLTNPEHSDQISSLNDSVESIYKTIEAAISAVNNMMSMYSSTLDLHHPYNQILKRRLVFMGYWFISDVDTELEQSQRLSACSRPTSIPFAVGSAALRVALTRSM